MRRRPPHIPVRRQIYIGCEGASEVGYAAILQDLANATALPVYLKIEELGPGAGDPLARIEMAVRRIDLQRCCAFSGFPASGSTAQAPRLCESSRSILYFSG